MTDPMRQAIPPEETVDGAPLEEAAAEELPAYAAPQEDPLAVALRERDEWKDKAFRTAAEAENIKRRAQQEATDARQYAVTKFAADVLGVGDNLARALSAPEGNEKALREGILMTASQLQGMLSRHGVQAIPVQAGDALNPDLHQAMSEVPSADIAAGCIVQELQAGFTINGRLLRPSLVIVAKAGE